MKYPVSKYAIKNKKQENSENQLNHWSKYIRKSMIKNETLFMVYSQRNLLEVCSSYTVYRDMLVGPIP